MCRKLAMENHPSPKIKKKSPELINKLLKNLTKIKYKKNCKFSMFS